LAADEHVRKTKLPIAMISLLLVVVFVAGFISYEYIFAESMSSGLIGTGIDTSSSTSSNGIELLVTISPTVLPEAMLSSGKHLNVTTELINTLPRTNNVTIPKDWTLPALVGPCGPIGLVSFAFYSGNYTISNIASATPLPEEGPGVASCPAWGLHYLFFQPSSDNFTIAGQSPNAYAYARSITQFTGYYSASAFEFVNFPPGIYTIAVGDTWGNLVLVHFTVV